MEKINRTTQFILPLLIKIESLDIFRAYLGIDKFDDLNGIIYLKILNNEIKLNKLNLKNPECYQGLVYIENNPIFIVKLPDRYISDFHKFIVGNYTEISLDTRREIYYFWFHANSNIIDTNKITSIVFDTLFDYDLAKIELFTELLINDKDYKDIIEVNSIMKLTDELLIV